MGRSNREKSHNSDAGEFSGNNKPDGQISPQIKNEDKESR